MPASEYTNKFSKKYFSARQKWKHKKLNTQEWKERKSEEKVLIFTQLYFYFCFNSHQNLQVEVNEIFLFSWLIWKIFRPPFFQVFLFFPFEYK